MDPPRLPLGPGAGRTLYRIPGLFLNGPMSLPRASLVSGKIPTALGRSDGRKLSKEYYNTHMRTGRRELSHLFLSSKREGVKKVYDTICLKNLS